MSLTSLISSSGASRPPTPLAVVIRLLLCGTPLLIAPGFAQATVQPSRVYAIPAGQLNQQLSQFAAQSGVYLAGDASLATGSGTALTGNYGVEEGFGSLRAGRGMQAVRKKKGEDV
ncbi:hypothetical protein [Klebsiella variicola]|uniref:hypothetical protein n=1 Tax=Klebsiella variicola TaxID=244366 RepID=UPI001BD5CCA0|nr:hypothetical protein [Klebsiella variicola]